MIVHSVFCFRLLFACVLHSLCVYLEGHSAVLHTPRFFTPRKLSGVPTFSLGDPIFLLTAVYCLPPLPLLPNLALFFSMKWGPAAVSFLPKKNFLQVPVLFSSLFFVPFGSTHQYQNRFAQCTARLLWFRLFWFRLLWFAALYHLLLRWHKTIKPP